MTRFVVRSRVSSDGMLRVVIPIGEADADRELQITIEPVPAREHDDVDYCAWLDSIAGQWQGEFEQMPQGEFEHREPL